ARLRADSLHQAIKIPGITRLHDVSFETLDHQHPTQLTGEIPALGFGEHVVERLLIGLPRGLGTSCRLSEFLLDRDARETRLDPANRIYVRDRHGSRTATASRTGRLGRRSRDDVPLRGCDQSDT